MKKDNKFITVLKDKFSNNYFTLKELKSIFPGRHKSSLYQSLYYHKQKGLIEKDQNKYRVKNQNQNQNQTMEKLELTKKEQRLFNALFNLKSKFIEQIGERRVNKNQIVEIALDNGCDEKTWEALSLKLKNINIISKISKCDETKLLIYSINEDKLLEYLVNPEYIEIVLDYEEIAQNIENTLAEFNETISENSYIESSISELTGKIKAIQAEELKLQKKLDELESRKKSITSKANEAEKYLNLLAEISKLAKNERLRLLSLIIE